MQTRHQHAHKKLQPCSQTHTWVREVLEMLTLGFPSLWDNEVMSLALTSAQAHTPLRLTDTHYDKLAATTAGSSQDPGRQGKISFQLQLSLFS